LLPEIDFGKAKRIRLITEVPVSDRLSKRDSRCRMISQVKSPSLIKLLARGPLGLLQSSGTKVPSLLAHGLISTVMEGIKEKLLSVDADRGYQNNTCSHIDVVVCKADSRVRSRAMRRRRPKLIGRLEQQEETGTHLAFASCTFSSQRLTTLNENPNNDVLLIEYGRNLL
jgi:hypothetical protein